MERGPSRLRGAPPSSALLAMAEAGAGQRPGLALVRVKRRPGLMASTWGFSLQPQRCYTAVLWSWLNLARPNCSHRRGDDPHLTLDMYADGDQCRRSRATGTRRCSQRRSCPRTMIFHSFDFVVFFLLVISVVLEAAAARAERPAAGRQLHLLRVDPPVVLSLMGPHHRVDYACGRAMQRWPAHKRSWLCLQPRDQPGHARVLQVLQLLRRLRAAPPWRPSGWRPRRGRSLDIVLPVGISFYTFQTMSYTIDVYRGELRARRDARRLRALRVVLPAAGGRARSSAPRTCCRSSSARARSTCTLARRASS